MNELILSILVHNSSGVLTRVSSLFARRGYNIDSLTVGPTNDPEISRMTVVAQGDERILEQIEKQLRKLEDVIEIFTLPRDSSVYRELVLVKVESDVSTRADIVSIVDIFRAKIVDVSPDSMVIEISGHQDKLQSFLDVIADDYQILELARTGLTGLTRGSEDVFMIEW